MASEKFEIVWNTSRGITYGLESELDTWLGSIADKTGKFPEFIKLSVKPTRSTRSIVQNNLYWAWCQEIADFENRTNGLGWDKDDAHRYLKSEFFIDIDEFEEAIRYLRDGLLWPRDFMFIIMRIMDEATTTKSDTKEFSEKLEAIKKHYEKKWLYLLFPDEPPLSSYDQQSE